MLVSTGPCGLTRWTRSEHEWSRLGCSEGEQGRSAMTPLREGAGRVVGRGLRRVRTQVESEVSLLSQAKRGGLGAWMHTKPEQIARAGEADGALLRRKSARTLHCLKQVERRAASREELGRDSTSWKSACRVAPLRKTQVEPRRLRAPLLELQAKLESSAA